MFAKCFGWVGQAGRGECSYVPRSAPKRSLRVGYLAREGIDERRGTSGPSR